VIILDTNIISAVMTAPPEPSIVLWLNTQSAADLYLTTITLAEIHFGLHAMPDGRRRRALTDRFEQFVATGFAERILTFDEPAALAYAALRAERRAIGRPMSSLDAQIAAIARTRDAAVATRNTRDFDDCGLRLINPYQA
jgi:predicted nucleic acid-binding protein